MEKPKRWPVFEMGTDADMERLAGLRGISPVALELARSRGFLRFADTPHGRAWIVTDASRIAAQARLMSGEPWPGIGAKAKTLPGSRASHPLGVDDIGTAGFVAIVEGGPDFLAAIECLGCRNPVSTFSVVAMLGSSQRIPEADLPKFKGLDVRIFAHNDDAGRAAAKRWGKSIVTVARQVEVAHLHDIGDDVNGLLHVRLPAYLEHETRIEQMLRRPRHD